MTKSKVKKIKALPRDYDNLIMLAVFGYKINHELMKICRSWVEDNVDSYWHGINWVGDTSPDSTNPLYNKTNINDILAEIAKYRWDEKDNEYVYKEMDEDKRRDPDLREHAGRYVHPYIRYHVLKAYYLMGNPK